MALLGRSLEGCWTTPRPTPLALYPKSRDYCAWPGAGLMHAFASPSGGIHRWAPEQLITMARNLGFDSQTSTLLSWRMGLEGTKRKAYIAFRLTTAYSKASEERAIQIWTLLRSRLHQSPWPWLISARRWAPCHWLFRMVLEIAYPLDTTHAEAVPGLDLYGSSGCRVVEIFVCRQDRLEGVSCTWASPSPTAPTVCFWRFGRPMKFFHPLDCVV